MKIGELSDESQISIAVQTEPVLEDIPQSEPPGPGPNEFGGGTQANPFILDDEDLDPHGAISNDEDVAPEPVEPLNPIDDDKYFFGTTFEKTDEFDHHIDEPNPWHSDLKRPLFDSQIIRFRWMASRHSKGGGLVGDKVGCGKVIALYPTLSFHYLRVDLPSYKFHSLAQRSRRQARQWLASPASKSLSSGRV